MKLPKSLFLAPAIAIATLWAVPRHPAPSGFEVVYAADREGKVVSGSLDELVAAVQGGAALRVGWELPMRMPGEDALVLEHWTDAGFVSVWRGHVFAQLRDIYEQGVVITDPAFFLQAEPHGWTALVGTTGSFRMVTAGEKSEMRAATRWAVQR